MEGPFFLQQRGNLVLLGLRGCQLYLEAGQFLPERTDREQECGVRNLRERPLEQRTSCPSGVRGLLDREIAFSILLELRRDFGGDGGAVKLDDALLEVILGNDPPNRITQQSRFGHRQAG